MEIKAPKLIDYQTDNVEIQEAIDKSIEYLISSEVDLEKLYLQDINQTNNTINLQIFHFDLYKIFEGSKPNTNSTNQWVIYPPLSNYPGKHKELTYLINSNKLIDNSAK